MRQKEKPVNSFKFELESRSINESLARSCIAALIAQLDPTVDELADIRTAVSEAVTNCIVHAYPDQLGKIYISAALYRGGRVVIRVKDKGCGISDVPRAMEPLFTTGNTEERSGLGFSVMQSMMDRIAVRSKPGGPTVVTLEKRLRLKGDADGSV
ncbi:MAG: anti-sigma F factor [Oscillospiraceae bacterium]|uniref:Anti-sigma F factor n=1 Tax=Yanshouia hominis TaxID=2763673 RepID=A0ABR7NIQ4_9FIRM|nr:anti-sigma F factor [Yanshouia hominis]MBS1380841.1 anti-sigma F factor [Oscillospiraceae bacterium]MCM0707090.1 anti-sigma F factor [Faecalicatena sp. BF-R-105]MDY3219555.1 anti-sigma F factor [Candidatus Fimivivens sp.]SFJ18145.1 stage II sporulation protein AB (anti-sigma F factor) [Ruminococcaceae bacterium D5]GKH51460.1 anti-sigma F factor [Eubacteriales bacterium]